jgi:transcriptional antiterminator RfaH
MSSSSRHSKSSDLKSSDGHRRQWFCVQTKPRSEDFATANLQKKEITVFSPKIEEMTVRNHKNVRRMVPLFPRYVFAKLDLQFEHNKARWTPGVKQILSNRQGPIHVEDGIIDGIAAALKKKTYRKIEKLKTGDVVAVSDGSFSGLSGVFQCYTSGEARVRVLLDLIYRQIVTEFDSAIIKKI